jgi:hypothetical protein
VILSAPWAPACFRLRVIGGELHFGQLPAEPPGHLADDVGENAPGVDADVEVGGVEDLGLNVLGAGLA